MYFRNCSQIAQCVCMFVQMHGHKQRQRQYCDNTHTNTRICLNTYVGKTYTYTCRVRVANFFM